LIQLAALSAMNPMFAPWKMQRYQAQSLSAAGAWTQFLSLL